jgi:hypothetical protein
MVSRAAGSRVLVLVGVAALHAGGLVFLVTAAQGSLTRPPAETEPILVALLLEPRRLVPGVAPARPRRVHARAPQAPEPTVTPTPPAAPNPPAPIIDWAAEATGAAARAGGADQQTRRRAMGGIPAADTAFATRQGTPGFRWDSSHTHRFEPRPGGLTIVHLGSRCALVFWIVIPVLGGCTLDKPPPAHGDLFEHMDDPNQAQP